MYKCARQSTDQLRESGSRRNKTKERKKEWKRREREGERERKREKKKRIIITRNAVEYNERN